MYNILLPRRSIGIHFIYLSLQVNNLKYIGNDEMIPMQTGIFAIEIGVTLKSPIPAKIINVNMCIIKHSFSVHVDQYKILESPLSWQSWVLMRNRFLNLDFIYTSIAVKLGFNGQFQVNYPSILKWTSITTNV